MKVKHMKMTATVTVDMKVNLQGMEETMCSGWFWDEATDDREMNDDEYMHIFTEYAMDIDEDIVSYSDAIINCTPEQRAEILSIVKRGHKAWRATLAE